MLALALSACAALLLAGCAGGGQIANLAETSITTAIAFESIDGAPPAVSPKLMKSLREEALVRRIAVVAPGEANYRLRGYLAAHAPDGARDATAVRWALDVYDSEGQRAFRLSGEERTTGRAWAAADDRLLNRIARAGMDQFAVFMSKARPTATVAAAPPAAPSPRGASGLGWLDDWAPESAGIFRIFRREPARTPEMAADAGAPLPPEAVRLPPGRPAPAAPTSAAALAFTD